MKTVGIGGLVLGLGVVAWTFVMGFTGWYKHPETVYRFWLVIPYQITVLVLALRATARQGAPYVRQILNGTTLSLLGATIIFLGSYLFTTVVFPSYFQDVEQAGRAMMAARGLNAAEIEAAVVANKAMQTPLMNALAGAIGTSITGLLVSLLAAVWLRAKD